MSSVTCGQVMSFVNSVISLENWASGQYIIPNQPNWASGLQTQSQSVLNGLNLVGQYPLWRFSNPQSPFQDVDFLTLKATLTYGASGQITTFDQLSNYVNGSLANASNAMSSSFYPFTCPTSFSSNACQS
jgi:hypothetical protein